MIRLFCSCFITLVLIAANSFAQTKREYSGLFDTYYYRGPVSFTGGLGMAAYNGSLGTFTSPSYAFNLGASYKIWPRIALGAEFLYYQLKGSKTTDSITSSFSSSNMELDLYGRFYLIDDIVRVAPDRNKQPKLIKPYLTTGIGFLRYSPTLTYSIEGTNTSGAPKATSASGITMAIPFGGGVAVGVSPRISILADVTYRYTLSSNLDAIGSQTKDGYLLACVKVQFSPFVPVKKKKSKGGSSAPAPYEGTKGTETWKNRKKKPAATEDAYPPLPGEEQQNQDNPENPDQQNKNEGDENQQNPDQNQNEGGDNQDPNAPASK